MDKTRSEKYYPIMKFKIFKVFKIKIISLHPYFFEVYDVSSAVLSLLLRYLLLWCRYYRLKIYVYVHESIEVLSTKKKNNQIHMY